MPVKNMINDAKLYENLTVIKEVFQFSLIKFQKYHMCHYFVVMEL